MVVKKQGNNVEEAIGETKIPAWLNNLINQKWFFPLVVAAMIVLFVAFSIPASTRTEIMSNIFSSSDPVQTVPSGTDPKNPIANVTETPSKGSATPAATAKEKSMYDDTDWQSQYKKEGKIVNGFTIAPIGATNIPITESANSADISLINVKVNRKTGAVSGYIKNNGAKQLHAKSLSFDLESKGTHYGGMTIVILNNFNLNKKTGPYDFIQPGQELPFTTTEIDLNKVNPDKIEEAKQLIKTAPLIRIIYRT